MKGDLYYELYKIDETTYAESYSRKLNDLVEKIEEMRLLTNLGSEKGILLYIQ